MSLDPKDVLADAMTDPVTVAEAQKLVKVVKTPAEIRALDAFVNKRQQAEDSLRAFVEQAWDVLSLCRAS